VEARATARVATYSKYSGSPTLLNSAGALAPAGSERRDRTSSCELFQRGTGLAENSLGPQSLQDSDDSCDVPWLQWRTAAVGFPVAYNSVIGHHQLVFGDPGGNDFRRQRVTYSGTQYGNNLIFGGLRHAEFLANGGRPPVCYSTANFALYALSA